MARTWGGYDPGDPQFQQQLDAARQANERALRRGDKPPPKPTPMQRFLDPKGAKRVDEMRSSWGAKNKNESTRGFLKRKKKRGK